MIFSTRLFRTPPPNTDPVDGIAFDVSYWFPTFSAAVALLALAVNLILASGQRRGDNRVSANSVLLNTDETGARFILTNGGKSPILSVAYVVDNARVSREVFSLAAGASDKLTLDSGNAAAYFPHAIEVQFTDVRGLRWSKTPNKPARKRRINHLLLHRWASRIRRRRAPGSKTAATS